MAQADLGKPSPQLHILASIYVFIVGLMASDAWNVDGQTHPAVGSIATDGVVLVIWGFSCSECNVSPKNYSELERLLTCSKVLLRLVGPRWKDFCKLCAARLGHAAWQWGEGSDASRRKVWLP